MLVAEHVPPAFAATFVAVLLLGGGWLLVVFARRLVRVWSSRNWVETPCEVVAIRAVGIEDFSVEISFTYRVGESAYRSDRYSFADHLAVDDAPRVVERHPPGSQAVCYVNPADPADAVFVRSANVIPVVVMFLTGVAASGCGVYLAYLWATGEFAAN